MMETIDMIFTALYYASMTFAFMIWMLFMVACACVFYGGLCYGYAKGLHNVMSKTFLARMGEPGLAALTMVLTLPWAIAVLGFMGTMLAEFSS